MFPILLLGHYSLTLPKALQTPCSLQHTFHFRQLYILPIPVLCTLYVSGNICATYSTQPQHSFHGTTRNTILFTAY